MIKKGSLSKRYQTSYDDKNSSGGNKLGVMDWKKYDGEVSFFTPVEGRNSINIIPYQITSKNHPLVKRGEFEVGDSDYLMDVYVHKGIGLSKSSILCPKGTYGKPCPICEQQEMLKQQGKDKESAELKPKRRVYYNVEDLKDPGTVKVFEASHFLFEKELIDEARNDEGGGFTDFADPENGKEIKFRASTVEKGSIEYLEFKSFSFADRDPLDEKLLDQAVPFDSILKVLSYDEIKNILFCTDEDDNDEIPEDFEDEAPRHKAPAKSRRAESDDDDDDERPARHSKVSRDEDDDDEPAPRKSRNREETDETEDSDSEEKVVIGDKPHRMFKKPVQDDEEEEPEERPRKKYRDEEDDDSDDNPCKYGHKFGEDTDDYDDCNKCNKWDKCCKANK